MTQTISIARGTVSSAADGTTRSTLFTNSASVIATRVIVNQVAWTTSNSISGGPYKAALIHYNAAGQYSVLGLQTHAYPYSCGFQFNIGTTPEAYFASSTNSYFGVQKIFQNGAGQIGTDINAIDCPVISQNVPNNTNFCASQFWIGPSDVISFAVYSRPCKIRFSKSALRSLTKNRIFDHHVSDPIARARHPGAPKRTV